MVKLLVFAIILSLYSTICLSCGVPDTIDYSLEISTEPSDPVVGEPLELRCRVAQPYLQQWQSTVISAGSKLTWSEGGVLDWTAYRGRQFTYDSSQGEVVLRISSFTIEDYGVYKCQCINDFTYLQYELCGGIDGLATHCSNAAEIYLEPPIQQRSVSITSVTAPGETVTLPSCTNGWVRIDSSSGSREDLSGRDVIINSPQDEAKFICDAITLQQIVYVTIPDYQPLEILYPTSDTANLRLSLTSAQIPACATLTSSPSTTNTTVYLYNNNMAMELVPNPNDHSIALDVEQCGWITIYFFDTFVLEVLKNEPGATIACIVSNQWESMARNFTFESLTVQPQSCPALPSILPFTSIAPTSSPMITSSSMITPSNKVNEVNESRSNNHTGIIAGTVAIVIVVILLIILSTVTVLVIIVRRHRRRSPRKMYRLPDNDESFAPESNLGYPSLIETHTNQQFNGFSHSSIQQFSHNGVPVSRQMAKCISALQQSPWLFPYEKLEFQEELGSGAFGVVKKALAHSLQPGEPATVVAVKMLKDGADSDEQEEKDIISELKVLQHVGAHPNIVCLLGASVNNGMLYVIVEYCCNGNLLKYLRSKRNDQSSPLTARHCVDMAVQVATGMEFLTSKDCIHRDLAARNVLITDNFVLKVADFGLARKIYESVYRPSGGKVPVKWLAPESIIDHMYTAQSDVWSFGIVLWEILTLGRTPYPGKSAETMLRDLQNGYRMPRPPSCPVQIYDIMLKCWQWNSVVRPTFSELVKQLEEILTTDEPSLNRHYYNMDISGDGGGNNDQTDIEDSNMCSCDDLLNTTTESGGGDGDTSRHHTCHSCGNTFTTNRKLSSNPEKIFCDDCSQMPEYLSRSSLDLLSTCDEGTIGKRNKRWSQRLHSTDSGVKVSSEGTSSDDYQVAAAFARKLAESLQSMCSECKIELDPAGLELWEEEDKDIGQSTSSLCTGCRELLNGHTYTNVVSPTDIVDKDINHEREEYMKQRMEKVLASRNCPRPKSIDSALLLHREMSGVSEEEEREDREIIHKENGISDSSQKVELRQKYSNDSGIKLTPEPVYLKRISAPPLTSANTNIIREGAPTTCFSPPTPRMSYQASGCSTPGGGRLSAHPRNRDIFKQLGFEETDL